MASTVLDFVAACYRQLNGTASDSAEAASAATSVPQTVPVDAKQVVNSAGGFVFAVSDLQRLRRFLVLGSEGGTYYASEQKLGLENAANIKRLLDEGKGVEVVATITEFNVNARAAKTEPALFALAMCARLGDDATRAAALKAVSAVCRIPTHLFAFIEYSQNLSKPATGWGRATRRTMAEWYNGKEPLSLALAVTKYKNRNGWTHRDVLRLSHVVAASKAHNLVLNYAVNGASAFDTADAADESAAAVVEFLKAVEATKTASVGELVELINKFRLVREHLPSEMLSHVPVWEALLADMPMTAMIRNLGKMTSIGLIDGNNAHAEHVAAVLSDTAALKKARIHPFNVLVALRTYSSGHGDKGSLSWKPSAKVVDALESAYYQSFKLAEPTGKRFLLALDVSGSMSSGSVIGSTCLTPREAAAAMSMVAARTERDTKFMAFSNSFIPLNITASMKLKDVISTTSGLPFSSTDCSLPITWALQNRYKIDVFVVYTDNETFAGKIHPSEALAQYRRATGIDAKLIVVAFTSTRFTIADPDDPGMLDMAGFDSAAPEIMRDFVVQ